MLEEGGIPVTLGLKLNDPFLTSGCQFGAEKCLISEKHKCNATRAVYTIKCKTCLKNKPAGVREDRKKPGGIVTCHYIGMTATTVHNRLLAHMDGHRSCDSSNALHRHDVLHHGGEVQEYIAEVIQIERNLLNLDMREAILIEGQDPSICMNDRMERGRGALIRLYAERGVS